MPLGTQSVGTLPDAAGGESPQLTFVTTATVAAGASADLDSAQVTTDKTAHLLALVVASSVPFKAVLQSVLNGVATTKVVSFRPAGNSWDWSPPGGFITAVQDAGVGFDGFRVVITNLDTSEAADVYATFLYDEI